MPRHGIQLPIPIWRIGDLLNPDLEIEESFV